MVSPLPAPAGCRRRPGSGAPPVCLPGRRRTGSGRTLAHRAARRAARAGSPHRGGGRTRTRCAWPLPPWPGRPHPTPRRAARGRARRTPPTPEVARSRYATTPPTSAVCRSGTHRTRGQPPVRRGCHHDHDDQPCAWPARRSTLLGRPRPPVVSSPRRIRARLLTAASRSGTQLGTRRRPTRSPLATEPDRAERRRRLLTWSDREDLVPRGQLRWPSRRAQPVRADLFDSWRQAAVLPPVECPLLGAG